MYLRLLFVGAIVGVFISCTTVTHSPSPDFSSYRAQLQKEPGDVSVSGTAHLDAGIQTPGYLAGTIRMAKQQTMDREIGLSITFEKRTSDQPKNERDPNSAVDTGNYFQGQHPDQRASGRLHTRYDLAGDWLDSMVALSGGGTDTELIYGAVDSGLVLEPNLSFLKPYLSTYAGASIPIKKGDPMVTVPSGTVRDNHFATTTMSAGAAAGLGVYLGDDVLLSAGHNQYIIIPFGDRDDDFKGMDWRLSYSLQLGYKF